MAQQLAHVARIESLQRWPWSADVRIYGRLADIYGAKYYEGKNIADFQFIEYNDITRDEPHEETPS